MVKLCCHFVIQPHSDNVINRVAHSVVFLASIRIHILRSSTSPSESSSRPLKMPQATRSSPTLDEGQSNIRAKVFSISIKRKSRCYVRAAIQSIGMLSRGDHSGANISISQVERSQPWYHRSPWKCDELSQRLREPTSWRRCLSEREGVAATEHSF